MKPSEKSAAPRTVLTRKRYLTQLGLWAASLILFVVYVLINDPMNAPARPLLIPVVLLLAITLLICIFMTPSAPAAPELPDEVLDRFLPANLISNLLRLVFALAAAGFVLGAASTLLDIEAVCTDGVYAFMRNDSVLCEAPKWLCVSFAHISDLHREFAILSGASAAMWQTHIVFRIARPEKNDISQE